MLALGLAMTAAAVVVARVAFAGPALASRVCTRLNADMRGRVEIGAIDWPLASLPTVARGGWVPVVLQDVHVTDADGVVVLRAATVRAEVDVHRVLFGHHDVVARRVVVSGGEVVLREVPARAPRYAGDTDVSLVAAFDPRAERAPGARVPAGPRLELRDVAAAHVRVTVAALPVDAAATRHDLVVTADDADASGALAYDPRATPARLVFALRARGRGGEAVVRERRFALTRLDLRALAPTDARDVVLDASVALAGGERVDVAATLHDDWPTGHFGRGSRVGVTAAGLRHTLAVDPPIDLVVPPLAFRHDLHTGEGVLAGVAVDVAGGRVQAAARWGGGADGAAPSWLSATLATERALDLRPWLRADVRRELGHALRGRVALSVDQAVDGLVHLGDPDLTLGRLRVDAGELIVERANQLRLAGVHFSVPGLEGTYDCTLSPGPPVRRRCEGRSSGDARVLLRLRKLDTW